MIYRLNLPFNPPEAKAINDRGGIIEKDDTVLVIFSGAPRFTHQRGDRVGEKVARVPRLELGAVRKEEISPALGVDCGTLYRQQRRMREEGIPGLMDKKKGPRGGINSRRRSARRRKGSGNQAPGPRERSDRDAVGVGGIKRQGERVLAMQGGLREAASRTYGRMRQGVYGLRSLLLVLAFMALLRIKAPERGRRKGPEP